MLLVDYMLHLALGGWTLQQRNALNADLLSRMLKVKVADRSIIKCNDNKTKCLAPASVQLKLEEAMAKFQLKAVPLFDPAGQKMLCESKPKQLPMVMLMNWLMRQPALFTTPAKVLERDWSRSVWTVWQRKSEVLTML
jgi:hypothetical protein